MQYYQQKRMKRCHDCHQAFEGKSAICSACYDKRPQCKGKFCQKKTAPKGDGEYFTYCQGCSCITNGCHLPHKQDSIYCEDCECPNCKKLPKLHDSNYCDECCCRNTACRDKHSESTEFCNGCLDIMMPICKICETNRSTPGHKTCRSCHEKACTKCHKKGFIFSLHSTLCKQCKCIAQECNKERAEFRWTDDDGTNLFATSLFCEDCYKTKKCSTDNCNRFRGQNTDLCYVCFQKKDAPMCQRQGCERRVGKNEATDQYYPTCFHCKCITPGCNQPSVNDEGEERGECNECLSRPMCKATGCESKVINPVEVYCNLCLYQWNKKGHQKCQNVHCVNYTDPRFSYCRDCNSQNKKQRS